MNQSEPKFIGKRIKVRRGRESLEVEITQQVQRWQETLLLAWLAAWTFCGVVFVYYAISTQVESERIFFIIASSLWLFFFVRILKVFLWRKVGKEILHFSDGKLRMKNSFGLWGRTEEFNYPHIMKLGLITKDPTSFLAFLDDSFWIIAGDRVGFNYNGQKIRLGKQLSVKDAELLVRVMESALKEYRSKG